MYACVNIYLPSLIFVELETAVFLPPLPYVLGEKAASKQIPVEIFFKVVNVS